MCHNMRHKQRSMAKKKKKACFDEPTFFSHSTIVLWKPE